MKKNVKTILLAVGMLSFGTLNTISTKKQDIIKTPAGPGLDPTIYAHPVIQTFCMFIGESLSFLAYLIFELIKRIKNKTPSLSNYEEFDGDTETPSATSPGSNTPEKEAKKPVLPLNLSYYFALPCLMDLIGTSIMHLGLLFTYPSAYQMLRSASVVFVAMLSKFWLKHRLGRNKWLGVGLIVLGTIMVALVTFEEPDEEEAPAPLLGDCLVVFAQLFVGLQFVSEEKFFDRYSIPGVRAVGLEGLFGSIMTLMVLPLTQKIMIRGEPLEDVGGAVYQIKHCPELQLWVCVSILSIAVFNVFGVSVTQHLSSGSRATVDACRTFTVWLVSLMLGWEEFLIASLVAFLVVTSGTLTYNKSSAPAPKHDIDAVAPHNEATTLAEGRVVIAGDESSGDLV